MERSGRQSWPSSPWPSSVIIAELTILRFLTSHRSFREIGEQLSGSANRVKIQAHAVYKTRPSVSFRSRCADVGGRPLTGL